MPCSSSTASCWPSLTAAAFCSYSRYSSVYSCCMDCSASTAPCFAHWTSKECTVEVDKDPASLPPSLQRQHMEQGSACQDACQALHQSPGAMCMRFRGSPASPLIQAFSVRPTAQNDEGYLPIHPTKSVRRGHADCGSSQGASNAHQRARCFMLLCSSSAEVGMGPPQKTPLLACLCWRPTCCCSAC